MTSHVDPSPGEEARIRERYARRDRTSDRRLHDPLNPFVYMELQERERALIRWIGVAGLAPLDTKRVLEVGCGAGGNLAQMIRLGFEPGHLTGVDLLESEVERAKKRLPDSVQLFASEATKLDTQIGEFDVVLQSTVFSSVLDRNFQIHLASFMWDHVKPGGGVLWHDFTYDNPSNPDVRGVPVSRVRELFPAAPALVWRMTPAPPLGRRAAAIHPQLYTLLNLIPFVRTHVLAWIPRAGADTEAAA